VTAWDLSQTSRSDVCATRALEKPQLQKTGVALAEKSPSGGARRWPTALAVGLRARPLPPFPLPRVRGGGGCNRAGDPLPQGSRPGPHSLGPPGLTERAARCHSESAGGAYIALFAMRAPGRITAATTFLYTYVHLLGAQGKGKRAGAGGWEQEELPSRHSAPRRDNSAARTPPLQESRKSRLFGGFFGAQERKQNHVADGARVGEEHGEAINADAFPARRERRFPPAAVDDGAARVGRSLALGWRRRGVYAG